MCRCSVLEGVRRGETTLAWAGDFYDDAADPHVAIDLGRPSCRAMLASSLVSLGSLEAETGFAQILAIWRASLYLSANLLASSIVLAAASVFKDVRKRGDGWSRAHRCIGTGRDSACGRIKQPLYSRKDFIINVASKGTVQWSRPSALLSFIISNKLISRSGIVSPHDM